MYTCEGSFDRLIPENKVASREKNPFQMANLRIFFPLPCFKNVSWCVRSFCSIQPLFPVERFVLGGEGCQFGAVAHPIFGLLSLALDKSVVHFGRCYVRVCVCAFESLALLVSSSHWMKNVCVREREIEHRRIESNSADWHSFVLNPLHIRIRVLVSEPNPPSMHQHLTPQRYVPFSCFQSHAIPLSIYIIPTAKTNCDRVV